MSHIYLIPVYIILLGRFDDDVKMMIIDATEI